MGKNLKKKIKVGTNTPLPTHPDVCVVCGSEIGLGVEKEKQFDEKRPPYTGQLNIPNEHQGGGSRNMDDKLVKRPPYTRGFKKKPTKQMKRI